MKRLLRSPSIFLALAFVLMISCKKDHDIVTYYLPHADAGRDTTITYPQDSILLDGRGTKMTDLEIKGYEWRKINGPFPSQIRSPRNIMTMVTGLIEGAYTFEIKVFDILNQISRDTVEINVVRKNFPPVASAGPDITIIKPERMVLLNGSGSSDQDNNIASYSWRYISGPSSYAIFQPKLASTQVSNLVLGKYQFELTVTDSVGASGKDTVEVSVNENFASKNARVEIWCGSPKYISTRIKEIILYSSANAQNDLGDWFSGNDRHVWSQLSGPSQADIGTPLDRGSAAEVKITNLNKGKYVFQVKASFYNTEASATIEVNVVDPEAGEFIFESKWEYSDWDEFLFFRTPERPDLFYENTSRLKNVSILLQGATDWIEISNSTGKYHYYPDDCNRYIQLYSYYDIDLLIGQKVLVKLKFE